MTVKDRFLRIRDYIDAQNILDELESFLSDEELNEFCLELEDEYEIDLDEDDYYDE
jgi:hypothetical protein